MLKISPKILLTLLFFSLSLSGCVASDNLKKIVLGAKISASTPENYFKVTKVVDGDTIDIDYFGKTERLRLIGINTPESVDPRRPVECFGKEASDQAKKLLTGKLVKIEKDSTQDDRDKYGRMLRYITTKEGLFYNIEIIKTGFAHEYTFRVPYKYQKDFKTAEEQARKNKLGLWADNACAITNAKAKKIATSTSISQNIKLDNNCQIKGNVNGRQKIYHMQGCRDYSKIVIKPQEGDKIFCTEVEAKSAGFRKAKNCN